jgi:hypothetical protein
MVISRICKALLGGCCLLAALAVSAQQQLPGVLGLSYKIGRPSIPAAAYQKITVAEFRSMVSKAFQKSGFSLVAVDAQKNKSTIFQFRFDAYPKVEPKPIRVFLEDGSTDLNIYGGDWWMANQSLQRSLEFAGYDVRH